MDITLPTTREDGELTFSGSIKHTTNISNSKTWSSSCEPQTTFHYTSDVSLLMILVCVYSIYWMSSDLTSPYDSYMLVELLKIIHIELVIRIYANDF